MQVPGRRRRRLAVLSCVLVAAALAAAALAYFLFATGGAAAPALMMTPAKIYVAPGMTVDYGSLTVTPAGGSGVAELNASAPAGLAVKLSSAALSVEQPEPVSVTLSAANGTAPGEYSFHIEVQLGQARSDEAFAVDVVPALVIIQHEKFQPASLTVVEGTEVTWINLDTTIGCCDPGYHNVTFLNGTHAASPVLERFYTWNYTFDATGTFDYHCSIHPFMLGSVTVVA